MKKVLITIIAMLLPMLASADAVEIDGIYYNLNIGDYTASVSSNPNKYSGVVNIPEKITYEKVDYVVNSIGSGSFFKNYSLSSVIIPNSVTTIGESAFEHCNGLNSITIGSGVKNICINAFDDCKFISSVHISDLKAWCSIIFAGPESNPLYFAKQLFINGEEVKTLVIPSNVTSICEMAFYNCKNLTSLIIHNGVTSIGGDAFKNCIGLTSATIGNSVTSIGNGAFCGCSGLTSITIPNSVTSIGSSAFSYSGWYNNQANGLLYLDKWLLGYKGDKPAGDLMIVEGTKGIAGRAFSGCSGLTSVAIPNSVISIGQQAFANCDELTDVYCLANQVPSTNLEAFKDSNPQAMTLHVPAASIEAYRSTEPWSYFKAFVALEDGDTPTIQKCATPEINYADGKLDFTCETEGVEFVSEVIVGDAKKYYDASVTLSQTYKITVYAVKTGYENSDIATREIVIENGQSSLFGDLNKDGKVDVADHVKLSDIIMNK